MESPWYYLQFVKESKQNQNENITGYIVSIKA